MSDKKHKGQELISDEMFNHHLENAVAMAKTLAEGEESLMPHLILLLPDEEDGCTITLLALDVEFDASSKYQVFERAGYQHTINDKTPIVAFYLIAESWLNTKPDVLPRLDPERREVVMVSGMTLDMRLNMAIIDIFRDESNHIKPGLITMLTYGDSDSGSVPNKLLMSFVRGYATGMISSWN
ncbi:MAG: hypothetical protein H6658_02220 [Ardenticatenaceae bacterium]|nr:hypothetical protein [Ardenticatenaceae bacterium]